MMGRTTSYPGAIKRTGGLRTQGSFGRQRGTVWGLAQEISLERYPFLSVDLLSPGSPLSSLLLCGACPHPPLHPALCIPAQNQSSVAKTSQGTMETCSLKTLLVV